MHAAVDLMIIHNIHVAAVPLHNNDIFKKQLNSMVSVIDLNKTAFYCPECTRI